MAGANQFIDIEIDDREVAAALQRLEHAGTDMEPAYRDVGEELLNSTRARFESETAPDGTPWAPLSESYKKRKPRNKDQILTLHGELSGTLDYQADADGVAVGSPLVYAATHQFGAARGAFGQTKYGVPIPWGDIPARPYLGLSDEDRAKVLEIIQDHLDRAIGG